MGYRRMPDKRPWSAGPATSILSLTANGMPKSGKRLIKSGSAPAAASSLAPCCLSEASQVRPIHSAGSSHFAMRVSTRSISSVAESHEHAIKMVKMQGGVFGTVVDSTALLRLLGSSLIGEWRRRKRHRRDDSKASFRAEFRRLECQSRLSAFRNGNQSNVEPMRHADHYLSQSWRKANDRIN